MMKKKQNDAPQAAVRLLRSRAKFPKF